MRRIAPTALSILLAATIASGQGNSTRPPAGVDVIQPGSNLVVQGIPAIPAELAAEVKKYTEVRPVGFGGWHPIKREMLVAKRVGNTTQVHLLTTPLGTPKQLTDFPDNVGGGSYQPKTGDYFVFSKAEGGNEIFQMFRYDLATGTSTRVTNDDKKRIGGGPWSNSGTLRAYTAVMTGAGSASESFKTELRIMDPSDPGSDKLVVNFDGAGWSPIEWSPDDKKLVVGQYVSVNESFLWLFDLESGEKTLLTPKSGDEKVVYGGGQFSKDGKGLYVVTDKGSEFQRLYYFDLATKQMETLTAHINWDVDAFWPSWDGKWIAFVTNEDGFSKLHLLDTKTRKEVNVPKLPPGMIGGVSWHRKTNEMAFVMASHKSFADTYSIDLATGKTTHWTKSELNGYPADGSREPEMIRWDSFDGKKISGFIYRPPSKHKGKRPVIIDIHGGPEGQSRPGGLGRNGYYVSDLGIAIIRPNVRGSSGYGKTFLQLDNGYKREDSVKDIGSLLDWIAKQPDLDKDRILVTGGSYGGYMTLAVATNYNDRICCSVDIVGISNFNTFLKNTETYRRDLRRVEYGDERDPKMFEFLEKISPLTNAKKITKPLFVIQGKNDPRVPYTEAEQILAAARSNNTPVWYLMANDEGHGFAKKNNQDYQFYATTLFIKEFLLK